MAVRGLSYFAGVHPDKLAAIQAVIGGRKRPSVGEGVVTGQPVKRQPKAPTGARPVSGGKGDLLTRIAQRLMAERRANQRGNYLR